MFRFFLLWTSNIQEVHPNSHAEVLMNLMHLQFAFLSASVHPNPAPWGFSLETVHLFHHLNPPSGSVLSLMFYFIIVL